jgi:hypothetical protein
MTIEELKDLLAVLANNSIKLDKIEETLKSGSLSGDEYEELYTKEFMLCIENSGLYEDILLNLDRIEASSGVSLDTKRIRKQAEEYLRVKIIDV